MQRRGALQSYKQAETRLSKAERAGRSADRQIRTGKAMAATGHAALGAGQVALSKGGRVGKAGSYALGRVNKSLAERGKRTGAYSPRFGRNVDRGLRVANTLSKMPRHSIPKPKLSASRR